MDEQIMYYWDYILRENKPQEPKINDYILHFALINESNNDGINKWICCDNMNKLLGLAKYLILPSIQLSRAIIKKENQSEICFGTMGYADTIEAFDDIESDIKFKEEYEVWFTELDKYNKEAELELIRNVFEDINKKVDYKDGIVLTLEVYKNIQEVGLQLIKDYEDEEMIDVLEECFNFNRYEIETMFNNLDKNKFLLKRIIPILYNLNMI